MTMIGGATLPNRAPALNTRRSREVASVLRQAAHRLQHDDDRREGLDLVLKALRMLEGRE